MTRPTYRNCVVSFCHELATVERPDHDGFCEHHHGVQMMIARAELLGERPNLPLMPPLSMIDRMCARQTMSSAPAGFPGSSPRRPIACSRIDVDPGIGSAEIAIIIHGRPTMLSPLAARLLASQLVAQADQKDRAAAELETPKESAAERRDVRLAGRITALTPPDADAGEWDGAA